MYARRLIPALIVLVIATLAASTTYLLIHRDDSSTKVLGEKVTGSGQSGSGGQGNSPTANPPAKSFGIAGTVDGLYPGATVLLHLTVSSSENQPMTVQFLSARLTGVTKAPGAPTGACSGPLTIGTWTGTEFTLPKHASQLPAPGYIPITLGLSAPDACKGATFNLHYSGTAVQK